MGLECVSEAVPVVEERFEFRVAGRCGIAKCLIHDEPQASHRWVA